MKVKQLIVKLEKRCSIAQGREARNAFIRVLKDFTDDMTVVLHGRRGVIASVKGPERFPWQMCRHKEWIWKSPGNWHSGGEAIRILINNVPYVASALGKSRDVDSVESALKSAIARSIIVRVGVKANEFAKLPTFCGAYKKAPRCVAAAYQPFSQRSQLRAVF